MNSTEAKPPKKWRSVFSIAAAQFIDFGESKALATLFPSIRATLGLNVGHLGTIAAARRIVGLVFTPIWGVLADRYSRKAVLVWITGVWGVWTLFVGFSKTYGQMLVLMIIAGIGLAAIQSPLNSLISDLFSDEERGKAFGVIRTISFIGSIVAVLFFGQLADIPHLGWRIAFWIFGGLSVLSGLLIWAFVEEPVRGRSEAALADYIDEDGEDPGNEQPFAFNLIPAIFKTPTMLVILLEYIPNTFVFTVAITFLVTWLADDRGFEPGQATTMFAALVVGLAIGSVFGGMIGDWSNRRNPRRGRILVAQITLALVAVISFLLFQIEWNSFIIYAVLIFALGLLLDIRYSGAMAPITSAVLLPEVRTTGFASIQVMYTLAQALASLVIGQLAIRMGLTEAFFWTATVACAINFVVWFAFYNMYHQDAQAVQRILTGRQQSISRKTV